MGPAGGLEGLSIGWGGGGGQSQLEAPIPAGSPELVWEGLVLAGGPVLVWGCPALGAGGGTRYWCGDSLYWEGREGGRSGWKGSSTGGES